MAISLARAKVLCDKGELELVRSSGPKLISGMSAAELRRAETRARKLRDKWRDQSASQRRKEKAVRGRETRAQLGTASRRDAAANRNSAEKAELFEEVLARFTAQLAKSEAAGDAAGPLGRKRSTKTARSRTHRAARAEVRAEIKEAKRELKAGKKSKLAKSATKPKKVAEAATPADVKTRVKKKVAKKAPTAEAVVASGDAARRLDEPPASVKQPKRSGKPFEAGVTALEAGRKAQGLRVTKLQQLNASATAKQNRLLASGMLRIQKNRSAANKRAQGRRDSR